MRRLYFFIFVCFFVCVEFTSTTYAQTHLWTKTTFPSNFATSIEATPWGLMVGERNETFLNQAFNGVYISRDLGNSWEPLSLEKRKVTNLYYSQNRVFATTKDSINNLNGLFVSYDGVDWEHLGPNVGTYSVAVKDNTILLGTGNHGLHVSFDSGQTWEQKIGNGLHGPDIWEIELSDNSFYALTTNKVYVSEDEGKTWQELPALNGRNIRHMESNKNYVLAGSSSSGMYVSSDYGKTWVWSNSWGTQPSGDIRFFKGIFYAGRRNSAGQHSLYKSINGTIWEDTGLQLSNSNHNVHYITGLYTIPDKLLAISGNEGVYEYAIPSHTSPALPFLRIPWEEHDFERLVDKITSYFDHKYPLLGYGYHTEPEDSKNSTINYLGLEEHTPTLYYSAHNGYDFSLPYGTPVKAAADGSAVYSYCSDCGHTIKIDHGNGYQSIYMHLQEDGLITQSTAPIQVKAGDGIGKVGMTGKTSGPHLHFAIVKDKNSNGTFSDDFPAGNVDPFGWSSYMFHDPWPHYHWQDALGSHAGTESSYLWQDVSRHVGATFRDHAFLEFSNKKINIVSGSTHDNFTVITGNYGRPLIPLLQKDLFYIPKTSFYVELFALTGERIYHLLQPAIIEIDFSDVDLSHVIQETIKLYRYNSGLALWEPAGAYVLDLVNKKISAETSGFSHFALFAEINESIDTWKSSIGVRSASFQIQM